jgi:hypothetical protein
MDLNTGLMPPSDIQVLPKQQEKDKNKATEKNL